MPSRCPLPGDGSFKPADARRLQENFPSVYKQFSGQVKRNKALTGCVNVQKDTV